MMVDVGRKYFTVAWLREHIKELAYLKLNYLHLHLSDNLGFRLESATHPEVVSAQHYTKQEIADLVALAARYHVTIVPEIDMPGHMDQILASHPDLKLTSSAGTANNGYIDLSNLRAYPLMKDLIIEYLPLFPGPYWHLGADEYITDYASYPQLQAYARREAMYQRWSVSTFHGGSTRSAASADRNLGAKLHVWCDSPNNETEEQVAAGIRDPLRVIAQQTWDSPKPAPSFASFHNVITAVGRSTGWSYDVRPRDLALNRPTTASSQQNSDFPPAGATDGGTTSVGSSARSDPQWLQVDLGGIRTVSHVRLTWEPDTRPGTRSNSPPTAAPGRRSTPPVPATAAPTMSPGFPPPAGTYGCTGPGERPRTGTRYANLRRTDPRRSTVISRRSPRRTGPCPPSPTHGPSCGRRYGGPGRPGSTCASAA
jgi:Glycosyl hydrolase family 20, catalytic domain/F5/8 type C domain